MRLIKALAMIIACGLMLSCANLGVGLQAPKIKLVSVNMLPSEGLSQRFRIGLNVTNPNPVSLPVRGLSYSLALNGIEVVDGVSASVGRLAPYTETPLTLEAGTNLISALRFVNDFLRNNVEKPIDYNLKATIDVEGFARRLTIRESGAIPLSVESRSSAAPRTVQ